MCVIEITSTKQLLLKGHEFLRRMPGFFKFKDRIRQLHFQWFEFEKETTNSRRDRKVLFTHPNFRDSIGHQCDSTVLNHKFISSWSRLRKVPIDFMLKKGDVIELQLLLQLLVRKSASHLSTWTSFPKKGDLFRINSDSHIRQVHRWSQQRGCWKYIKISLIHERVWSTVMNQCIRGGRTIVWLELIS